MRARSKLNSALKSESLETQVKTLPEPSDIKLVKALSYSLYIKWDATLPALVAHKMKINYVMEYAQLNSNLWQKIDGTDNGLFNAELLTPKTKYQFRLKLNYTTESSSSTYSASKIWPTDSKFTYETLGKK